MTTGELEKNTGPTARLTPTAAAIAFGSTEDMATRLQTLADRGVRVEVPEYAGESSNKGVQAKIAIAVDRRLIQ